MLDELLVLGYAEDNVAPAKFCSPATGDPCDRESREQRSSNATSGRFGIAQAPVKGGLHPTSSMNGPALIASSIRRTVKRLNCLDIALRLP